MPGEIGDPPHGNVPEPCGDRPDHGISCVAHDAIDRVPRAPPGGQLIPSGRRIDDFRRGQEGGAVVEPPDGGIVAPVPRLLIEDQRAAGPQQTGDPVKHRAERAHGMQGQQHHHGIEGLVVIAGQIRAHVRDSRRAVGCDRGGSASMDVTGYPASAIVRDRAPTPYSHPGSGPVAGYQPARRSRRVPMRPFRRYLGRRPEWAAWPAQPHRPGPGDPGRARLRIGSSPAYLPGHARPAPLDHGLWPGGPRGRAAARIAGRGRGSAGLPLYPGAQRPARDGHRRGWSPSSPAGSAPLDARRNNDGPALAYTRRGIGRLTRQPGGA